MLTYLFWASAVVWIAVFAYLYRLARRVDLLEQHVTSLCDDGPPMADSVRTDMHLENARALAATEPGPVHGEERPPYMGASSHGTISR